MITFTKDQVGWILLKNSIVTPFDG